MNAKSNKKALRIAALVAGLIAVLVPLGCGGTPNTGTTMPETQASLHLVL